METEQGERASVAYDDICPKCDGIGFIEFLAYTQGEACDACHGDGRRKNRATASGGSDIHQNSAAPSNFPHRPGHEIGIREYALTDNTALFEANCTCGWTSGNSSVLREIQQEARLHERYLIQEEP